ncbi:hypothetical protein D3C84_1122040 [compost metagenome]
MDEQHVAGHARGGRDRLLEQLQQIARALRVDALRQGRFDDLFLKVNHGVLAVYLGGGLGDPASEIAT